MALIKCEECGREISDKAESCPNCGYTLKSVKTKNEQKQNKSIKKVGTILNVIGSAVLITFMVIILIAASIQNNTKTQNKVINKNADFNINVTIGEEQETNSTLLAISYFGSVLLSLITLILGILDLKNRLKHISLYGWIMLILSIVSLILMLISLNCCQVVFILCPVTCFIGSIMILIGNIKDKKNAIQENS